jgi:hypothetical protein
VLRVAVHEAIGKMDGNVFRCTLSGSDVDRWLEVPAWMFERISCPDQRDVAFGGLRVVDAVEHALLAIVSPGAISAATAAEREAGQRRDQVQDALNRDWEAAHYAADRAFRQYDAIDPANRLVANELEARWN